MEKLLSLVKLGDLGANVSSFAGPKELFGMLIALFIFLYGMSIGKTRALLSLLSVYVAFALTNIFPYFTQVTDAVPDNFQPYIVKASLFFVLYLGVFALLHVSSLKRMSLGELSMWKVLVISIIQIGFIGAVITSFMPKATALDTLKVIYPFFGSSSSLFIWSLISLGILPLMKHHRS